MSISKALSDSGWKDVAAKNKIKDNGLLKLLGDHKRIGDDKPDDLLTSLDQIVKLATQLKKAKEVAAVPAASKYVTEMLDAAESDRRAAAKAKAEADKKAKGAEEAEAKKREQEHKDGDAEEDESSELLTTKMMPLMKQAMKGDPMHVLVATTGKQTMVMLARKPISKSKHSWLAKEMGVSGGVKYLEGHCVQEEGMTTFALKTQVAGMAKKLKLALLEQTGLRVKVRCRGEDGDIDDDLEEIAEAAKEKGDGDKADGDKGPSASSADSASPEAGAEAAATTGMTRPFELGAAVGRGGKNLEDDVKAVQMALNRRAGAGLDVSGRCDPATLEAIEQFQRALGQSKPDGRIDPGRGTARALAASGKIGKPPAPPAPLAPPETLGEPNLHGAPLVWHGTRKIVDHNIGELKRAIRQEYANEHPKLLDDIDKGVQRVDVILEKLDTRLADTLERAGAIKDPAQRAAEIANAKKILTEYVKFVKSEPLIEHIDKNPFGVNAQLKKTLNDSLTHMIKSIA